LQRFPNDSPQEYARIQPDRNVCGIGTSRSTFATEVENGGTPCSARATAQQRRQPTAQINITPLDDVLLTVLIIFMVTAPLATKSIPFRLVGSDAAPKREPVVLGLSIRDRGERVLDGQSSSRFALDQRLRVAVASGLPVRLDNKPEATSSYDNHGHVLETANNNQITNLSVIAPTGQ
jgi:biopolymer transport protein ExbD